MIFWTRVSVFVLSLWTCSLPLATAVPPIPIDQALTIVPQGNLGGCTPDQITQIEQWWKEAYTLATAALAGIDNYVNNEVVRSSLQSFFAITWNPQNNQPNNPNVLRVIRSYYLVVQTYLATGILARPNYPSANGVDVPPANIRLYCNSNFLIFREKGSQAQDKNGIYRTTNGQQNGPPLAIQDVPQYQDALADKYIGEVDQNDNEIPTPQFPYWFPGPNDYFFDKKFAGTPPSYCGGLNFGFTVDAFIAGTTDYFIPFVLTMCPITFEEGGEAGQQNLGGKQPVQGDALDDYQSQGMTLFHELFHLVLGGSFTPDEDLYSAADCLLNVSGDTDPTLPAPTQNRVAPECLSQWANSYYYSTLVWGFRAGTGGNPNMEIHYAFVNGLAVPFSIPQR